MTGFNRAIAGCPKMFHLPVDLVMIVTAYRELAIATTVVASAVLILIVVYFLAIAVGPYVSINLRREFLDPQPEDVRRTDLTTIEDDSTQNDG